MESHDDRSSKKVETVESGDTSASLNIDTHPGNSTDGNVKTTPNPTSSPSDNCPDYGDSNTSVWNMELDHNSRVIAHGIMKRQSRWKPRRWVKSFDGKRISMDPQSRSSTSAGYTNPQASEEVLHPDMSSSGSAETMDTAPDTSLPNRTMDVQPLYDDAENAETDNLPRMMDSSRRDSNGETKSEGYSFLFTIIRAFLGLATATKKEKVKKTKIHPPVVFGIDKKSEIKCFDCGRNWDELLSEGTYIRITKCGHFLCNSIVRKLAKTAEKCPQCKQVKVYKTDCKICRLEP